MRFLLLVELSACICVIYDERVTGMNRAPATFSKQTRSLEITWHSLEITWPRSIVLPRKSEGVRLHMGFVKTTCKSHNRHFGVVAIGSIKPELKNPDGKEGGSSSSAKFRCV